MSDVLGIVAYFTRIVDSGDYYVVEYFGKKYIIRKRNIERDVMDILNDVSCHYAYAFLKILSLRVRIDVDEIMKNVRCQ